MHNKFIFVLILSILVQNLYGESIPDKYENEFIHAVKRGHYNNVKKLLTEGADPDQRFTTDGVPIIFVAVRYNYVDIVEALIQAGADINSQLSKGKLAGATPLIDAICRWRAYETALKLIQLGANVSEEVDECNILTLAISKAINNPERPIFKDIIKALIRSGINVNNGEPTRITALGLAVMKKSFYFVKLLIQAGADPNLSGSAPKSSPLYMSIYSDGSDLTIFKYLLDHGADPSHEQKVGALLKRATWFNKDAIPLLLEAGATKGVGG